jgi:cell fate (sporulation/competence/biofilm development) regulator YlbF (YheA/YmcA/DUF963 family)
MPADVPQILDAAEKLGQLVASHPVIERFKQAQKSLAEDADATRLLNDFNRQLMNLARQEESGMPVTDAQRRTLEGLQGQLAANLKVKALNLTQVEYVDLMRKVSDTIRAKVGEGGAPAAAAPSGSAPGGPKIVM